MHSSVFINQHWCETIRSDSHQKRWFHSSKNRRESSPAA